MAELLKNQYNYESLYKVVTDIHSVYEEFSVQEFMQSTLDEHWENLELKSRIHQISYHLGKYLPSDYSEAIGIINKVVMNYGSWLDNFCAFFPTFVEIYGQNDWEVSIAALARYTQYASSEFAVRSFIMKDEERMMKQMYEWSKSESEHVRRLACEGCRPALPWGQALVSFKKDPSPILPILEQLKNDPSLYVRKSVANNLNDISKTHPELVVRIAKDWYGKSQETDWIIKHGCRTLLKNANRDILTLFGYGDVADINVEDFQLNMTSLFIGEDISFSFVLIAKNEIKVRLEYGIDFVKANGNRNRKIFKISEVSLKNNERRVYTKRHSFANVSTRKHYPGIHSFTLIVNGIEQGTLDFELCN